MHAGKKIYITNNNSTHTFNTVCNIDNFLPSIRHPGDKQNRGHRQGKTNIVTRQEKVKILKVVTSLIDLCHKNS